MVAFSPHDLNLPRMYSATFGRPGCPRDAAPRDRPHVLAQVVRRRHIPEQALTLLLRRQMGSCKATNSGCLFRLRRRLDEQAERGCDGNFSQVRRASGCMSDRIRSGHVDELSMTASTSSREYICGGLGRERWLGGEGFYVVMG